VTIVNGLQVAHDAPVSRVAVAVDCTFETIQAAAAAGAQLLVVHHGINPQDEGNASRYREALRAHRLSLYASHLPLDAHPVLGNAAGLTREMRFRATGGFFEHGDAALGLQGECETPIATVELLERMERHSERHGQLATGMFPQPSHPRRSAASAPRVGPGRPAGTGPCGGIGPRCRGGWPRARHARW
jgi:putative NIF3 family GTP cyclohydrolase 1 type 2